MTYLLTGATGLIGNALVEKLLASGHAVNYLGSRRSRTLDTRASFHRWDRNADPDFGGIPRLDAVVNLAGEPISQRWNSEVKRRIYSSRVDGTRRLVDALGASQYKPKVLVSASAVGYYGERGDEVLTETSASGSGFLAEVCVDWEKEALRAATFGIRVVLIRIATVLSNRGGALKQMALPFKFGLGGKFGSGRQWMPWVELNDLVRLLIFASATESVHGPLNACSPEPVRNEDFTRALAQAVGRPAFIPVPGSALRLVLGELSGFVLASQRVYPAATEKSGFGFVSQNLGATLKSLL